MTYSDKIALFNKHAHLIAIQAEFEPRRIAPAKSALALQRPHPEGALKIVARARNRTASVGIAAQKRPPRLVGVAGRGGLRNQYVERSARASSECRLR